jgi:prepilin-type N-terminal cleavage/methylation domain-containing protein
MRNYKNKNGFTLLEILLVVGIIAILAGIVIIAINPSKQLADTRNAQRKSDVLTILNAVYQYTLDPGHTLDDLLIPSNDTCNAAESGDAYDLTPFLVGDEATYLTSIPLDPSTGDAENSLSRYFVDTGVVPGRVTVCAPDAENTTIQVTR